MFDDESFSTEAFNSESWRFVGMASDWRFIYRASSRITRRAVLPSGVF